MYVPALAMHKLHYICLDRSSVHSMQTLPLAEIRVCQLPVVSVVDISHVTLSILFSGSHVYGEYFPTLYSQ